jgi:hypothetical protein
VISLPAIFHFRFSTALGQVIIKVWFDLNSILKQTFLLIVTPLHIELQFAHSPIILSLCEYDSEVNKRVNRNISFFEILNFIVFLLFFGWQ